MTDIIIERRELCGTDLHRWAGLMGCLVFPFPQIPVLDPLPIVVPTRLTVILLLDADAPLIGAPRNFLADLVVIPVLL